MSRSREFPEIQLAQRTFFGHEFNGHPSFDDIYWSFINLIHKESNCFHSWSNFTKKSDIDMTEPTASE